jgi:hypothetical protein
VIGQGSRHNDTHLQELSKCWSLPDGRGDSGLKIGFFSIWISCHLEDTERKIKISRFFNHTIRNKV